MPTFLPSEHPTRLLDMLYGEHCRLDILQPDRPYTAKRQFWADVAMAPTGVIAVFHYSDGEFDVSVNTRSGVSTAELTLPPGASYLIREVHQLANSSDRLPQRYSRIDLVAVRSAMRPQEVADLIVGFKWGKKVDHRFADALADEEKAAEWLFDRVVAMPGTPEYEESMRLWGGVPDKLKQLPGIPEGLSLGRPVPFNSKAQLEWKPWLSDLYNHHGGSQGEQAGFVKLVGALSALCQRRFG